jgi:hypothetical protein
MTAAPSESGSTDADGCSRALESVTLEPRGSEWPSLVKRTPLTAFQIRLREQLGLPTDRPVIMSGHQAELWHPGILAKWFAGIALARRVGGVFVWLHVDQDTNEPGVIDVPAFDASGVLVKRTLTLIVQTKDIPTGARPWQRIDPASARPARGETLVDPDAVMRIVEALNRHADAPTLALQFGRTVEFLARDVMGEPTAPVHAITTSQLAATEAFTTMVDLLRSDPVRAAETHNLAAAASPEAGIRALGVKRSTSPEQSPRVELPLWRVKPGVPRTPVMLSQLDSIPLAELRPRALLMTGLARLGRLRPLHPRHRWRRLRPHHRRVVRVMARRNRRPERDGCTRVSAFGPDDRCHRHRTPRLRSPPRRRDRTRFAARVPRRPPRPP